MSEERERRRRRRVRRRRFTQPKAEYSSLRAGAIDFLESAAGIGDELDAVARLASGESDSWSKAIEGSRRELRYFERRNPGASKFITGAGITAGLFIPGMGVAKIAQAGTAVQRAKKAAALGAVEGAAYGFLSGEDEGRVTGALLGGGLGAGIGGAAGAYLTKGVPDKPRVRIRDGEVIEQPTSFIGGDEGFVEVTKATEKSKPGFEVDTSTQRRTTRRVDPDDERRLVESAEPEKASGIVGNVLLGTRQWLVKNVGERAARLAEDAETMIRHERRALDDVFENTFANAYKLFEDSPQLKLLSTRMNKSISQNQRVTWDMFNAAAKTPEEKAIVKQVEEQIKTLQALDVVKGSPDYFPTKGVIGGKDAAVMTPSDYVNPIDAIKEMAEDVMTARVLARRFGLIDEKTGELVLEQGGKALKLPDAQKTQGRVNYIIKMIELKARKEARQHYLAKGFSKTDAMEKAKAVSSNLGNGLRSQIIASKKGGDAAGAIARRLTSSALLANPLNAALNLIEGVTAPIYQNGIKAWSQTVGPAALRTIKVALDELGTTPILGKAIPKVNMDTNRWLGNEKLGLDQNFMGELANTGKRAVSDATDKFNFIRLPRFAQAVDVTGQALYKISGVSTVNRMGQEILTNSAIKRGMNLAKSGKAKDLEKLRKHDGMRGLTDSEFQATVNALKKGDLNSEWLINFAGSSLNKWQPVSASSLPKAFHDNPNARMFYSMLTYMNRQMNSIREDIGLNLLKAQRLGLNTAAGSQAAKDAMVSSAKYVGLFGVVAGVWDDARKTLDLSKNKDVEEVLTPEGITSATMNQLASNLSSGFVNIRSEQYGGKPVSLVPAPMEAAATLGSGLISSAERLATGEEDAALPALRAIRTYAPGLANIDRISRMTTGERLFEDYID